MKEQLISFETAKLAKEKGFDEYCISGYITRKIAGKYICDRFDNYKYGGDGSEFFEFFIDVVFIPLYEPFYKTPTQSLLQKWLREKHKIHINVQHYSDCPEQELNNIDYDDSLGMYGVKISEPNTCHEMEIYVEYNFYTYEQALEAGLLESLKLT